MEESKMVKLGEVKGDIPTEVRGAAKRIIQIKFPVQTVRFLRVKAKRSRALPSWHTKTNPAMPSIFVDEIAVE